MVAGVSSFLEKKGFPYSDSMMGYLREIFNADWVVLENNTGNIVASSLVPLQKNEFSKAAGGFGESGAVLLGGNKYRMDSSAVLIPRGQSESLASLFQEARDTASARVARVILIASAAATVLALLFAFTITRPIRHLASEMDHLSEKQRFGWK